MLMKMKIKNKNKRSFVWNHKKTKIIIIIRGGNHLQQLEIMEKFDIKFLETTMTMMRIAVEIIIIMPLEVMMIMIVEMQVTIKLNSQLFFLLVAVIIIMSQRRILLVIFSKVTETTFIHLLL